MKEKPISAEYSFKEFTWNIVSKFGSLTADNLCLVVGWGDPGSLKLEQARHAAIVIARKLDKTYTVVHEIYTQATGDLRDLARQLVNAKDLLAIKTCYVDKSQEEFYEYLRHVDGLTQYIPLGEREDGRIEYAQDPSTWPFFNGWDKTLDLVGISEEIFLRFSSHQAQLQHMIGTGKVKAGMRTPQLLAAQTAMPPGQWENNPFLRAFVAGIVMMEKEIERPGDSEIRQNVWYGAR